MEAVTHVYANGLEITFGPSRAVTSDWNVLISGPTAELVQSAIDRFMDASGHATFMTPMPAPDVGWVSAGRLHSQTGLRQ